MVPFLKNVAAFILQRHKDNLENLCIVLPNKRGAIFLKKYLASESSGVFWLPEIWSIEEWMEKLSGLLIPEETELIPLLYESYSACYTTAAEPFSAFMKWGQIMLRDFNEVDYALADAKALYENLHHIKDIENWSLGREVLSEHQKNYLAFMHSMSAIYRHFNESLLQKNRAYPGMAYRIATKKIRELNPDTSFIFCGFNALNAAERRIFLELQKRKKTDFLWDTDEYYLNRKSQEAGFFLRKNISDFGMDKNFPAGKNFLSPKNIRVISVPGSTGQVQTAAQLVKECLKHGTSPEKIAVVLANETLLIPLLRLLPGDTNDINITMSYPLRYAEVYGFTELLINIQYKLARQGKNKTHIHHKDFTAVLLHPFFRKVSGIKTLTIANELSQRHLNVVTPKDIKFFFGENYERLRIYFEPASGALEFLEHLSELTAGLMEREQGEKTELDLVRVLHVQINRLCTLLLRHSYLNDFPTLKSLFNYLVGNASVPFVGEPLQGMQIMGVLETRTLDFEQVILVNANEGVIPAARKQNSFLPNDLKKVFQIPQHEERDAVYAYHFYRLLQRAQNIVILSDSETDTFGKGEMSRFVTQLLYELPVYNPAIKIGRQLAVQAGELKTEEHKIIVGKTESVLKPLMNKARSVDQFGGLSPSSLIMFKECGLKFYFRYAQGLKEMEEVEEDFEAGTFGSILHLSLENLYRDLQGKNTLLPDLKKKLGAVDGAVAEAVRELSGDKVLRGKNILNQKVIGIYVRKLLLSDAKAIGSQNTGIKIHHLEKEFSSSVILNFNGSKQEAFLRGKIDRIDELSGMMRVIDYKSSVKESDKFIFSGFENLFSDKNYNKQLQLFVYAWLLYKNDFCPPEKLSPGIISFKHFTGDVKFILNENKKTLLFTEEILIEFESRLSEFISGIFLPGTTFHQTEDLDVCGFCAYKAICNR